MCAVLGTLLVLEAPLALAQSPATPTVPTTWGAIKRLGPGESLAVDAGLDPALVHEALQATRVLRPSITPRIVHGVSVDSGLGIAVSGTADSGAWVTHVLLPHGRGVSSTVFDFAHGVIRNGKPGHVVWKAPSGDLEADLRRVYETGSVDEMLRTLAYSFCQMMLTAPIARKCRYLVINWQLFLSCLGAVLGLLAFCYVVTHVSMPPDPNQEIGTGGTPGRNP